MDTRRCYQCGTDDPQSDHLGWLELRYTLVPESPRTFCGGACLDRWSRAAMARLTAAILGESAAPSEEDAHG